MRNTGKTYYILHNLFVLYYLIHMHVRITWSCSLFKKYCKPLEKIIIIPHFYHWKNLNCTYSDLQERLKNDSIEVISFVWLNAEIRNVMSQIVIIDTCREHVISFILFFIILIFHQIEIEITYLDYLNNMYLLKVKFCVILCLLWKSRV